MNSLRALWPPIRAIWRILAGQNRRGRIANRWARLVILGVVFGVAVPLILWPFVLIGVALTGSAGIVSAAAFLPLVALPVFVIILAAAYPLLSGILVTIPGVRVLFGWLFIVIFAELVIGLYLAVIPVWNSPGLIPVLVLLVVVLGMFLILRRQFVGLRGGLASWFSTALVLAIVGITIVFFFSGKKEAEAKAAEATSAIQSASHVQEFTLNADEEQVTVVVGPGTFHRIYATDKQGSPVEWLALSKLPDGSYREYRMRPVHSWRGGEPEGLLRVKGVADGTILRFERVNR